MPFLDAHRRRVPAQYFDSCVRVGMGFVAAMDTGKARLAFAASPVNAAAHRTGLRRIGGRDFTQSPAAFFQLVGEDRGRDVIGKMVSEYGHRALKAESQQGVDWEALSHAVRVARQAIELFQTGEIVFPLAYAPHLLAIKTGAVEYQAVADEIEGLLAEVESEGERSTLRESADTAWIDGFVAEVYRAAVERGP